MDVHLDRQELDRLVVRRGSASELGEWVVHLAFCTACREHLVAWHPKQGVELLKKIFGPQGPLSTWSASAAAELDEGVEEASVALAVERGLEAVPRVARERWAGEQSSSRVRDLVQARRLLVVRNRPDLWTYGFAQALIEEAERHWHSEPRQALELAELALEVWRVLDPEDYSEELLQSLGARVWAHVGNARRILVDYVGAEKAFREAWRQLENGGMGDPLDLALVSLLTSGLKAAQGKFDESLELSESAAEIYRDLHDTLQESKVLISQGVTLGRAGRSDEAVELVSGLLKRVSRWEMGERLYLAALQGVAAWQAGLGRYEEAQAHLHEIRSLAESHQDALVLARVDWLEATVLEGLGREAVAERKYLAVRETFLRKEDPIDAALVSLDLAVLYLKSGRGAETKRLAAETIAVFDTLEIHREALAALILFHEAVRQEVATVAYAREISSYLRHQDFGKKPPAPPVD